MNLLMLIRNWKDLNTILAIIQPFLVNLAKKQVPNKVTLLYENLAKYTQPAIDSLFRLKTKIKESPSELDDYCFEQGVKALETFTNYLIGIVNELKRKN